jgi:hypothetical protein
MDRLYTYGIWLADECGIDVKVAKEMMSMWSDHPVKVFYRKDLLCHGVACIVKRKYYSRLLAGALDEIFKRSIN